MEMIARFGQDFLFQKRAKGQTSPKMQNLKFRTGILNAMGLDKYGHTAEQLHAYGCVFFGSSVGCWDLPPVMDRSFHFSPFSVMR